LHVGQTKNAPLREILEQSFAGTQQNRLHCENVFIYQPKAGELLYDLRAAT
jgi:hypothetical protein